jgi:hypothetical protein
MRQCKKHHEESALLVGFSELLNKALLGPVFEKSGFTEMRRERDLVMASGDRDSSKPHTMTITGKSLGKILKVSSLDIFSSEVEIIEMLCKSVKIRSK